MWVAVVAAILQAILLLGVALVGLVVSYSFCDSSGALQQGYCDVRGLRWVVWVVCQLVLLLGGVAIPLLALLGVARQRVRRRLVQVEGAVAVASLVTAVLAIVTDTAGVAVAVGGVLLLGGVVVVAVRTRGELATP